MGAQQSESWWGVDAPETKMGSRQLYSMTNGKWTGKWVEMGHKLHRKQWTRVKKDQLNIFF